MTKTLQAGQLSNPGLHTVFIREWHCIMRVLLNNAPIEVQTLTDSTETKDAKAHGDSHTTAGTRLDHVAIAVNSLEETLKFYETSLGLTRLDIEVVEEQGVRVAKLEVGNTHIELLEPLSPDTPVGKFLTQRGPGLHHICIGVEDINERLACLKATGTKLINEEPKIGAGGAQIAFVHPKSTGGVLVELSQSKAN